MRLLLGAIGENVKKFEMSDCPAYPSVLEDVAHACWRAEYVVVNNWAVSPESLAKVFVNPEGRLESLTLAWDSKVAAALAKLLRGEAADSRCVAKLKCLHLPFLVPSDDFMQTIRDLEHTLRVNKTLEHLILKCLPSNRNPFSDTQVAQLSQLLTFHSEDLTPFVMLKGDSRSSASCTVTQLETREDCAGLWMRVWSRSSCRSRRRECCARRTSLPLQSTGDAKVFVVQIARLWSLNKLQLPWHLVGRT